MIGRINVNDDSCTSTDVLQIVPIIADFSTVVNIADFVINVVVHIELPESIAVMSAILIVQSDRTVAVDCENMLERGASGEQLGRRMERW